MTKQKHINFFSPIPFFQWLSAFFILMGLHSCSVSKYLQQGEIFYNGAKIKIKQDSGRIKTPKLLIAELNPLLRPVPNKKILGRRQKVWYYFAAGEVKKEKGLRSWMKNKLGQPPVLMNDLNPERNTSVLKNYLENNGYFFAHATYDTVWGKKQGSVTYTVTPGVRYHLKNIYFPVDSGKAAKLIYESKEESLLKPGAAYSFETLKSERIRIDDYLKNKGYYLFNPDYLLMRVDSTIGNHEVNVYVTVKNETSVEALRPWAIKNIYVFPNFTPASDTVRNDSTWWYNRYFVVDPSKSFKPRVFDDVISFDQQDIYSRQEHNKTLSRLVNLGAFRFVRNNFEELPNPSDTGLLNVYYYLYSNKKRNLRLETTGKSSSANLAGVELNINWRNRNMFRGAEQLMLKLYSGFDFQFAGQNEGYNIYHIGVEGSIAWPRMVPFHFIPKGSFVPFTKLSISNEWQRRQKLYTVNTLKTTYAWAWRPDLRREHYLAPLQVTYVDNRDVSQEYLDQIAQDSSLARVIEEQLIIGPEYTFIYNNTINAKRSNGIYFKGYANLSNNMLGAVQGADADNNLKKLLGVAYSQFIKLETDVRYYRKLSRITTDKQWVNRLDIGVGIPWGNSKQLPYIKQFFTGGANSNRAFRVRSVGPGTYQPVVTPDGFIPDLVGDIKLEMNSEFRTKLFSIVHGAAFVDAGNIWLFNENPGIPGGKFTADFWKELAVGAGLGLRFDIAGIFMIRLDWGIPLRKPWLPDGERWVIDDIQFGEYSWRRDNIITNLAVGLPF